MPFFEREIRKWERGGQKNKHKRNIKIKEQDINAILLKTVCLVEERLYSLS